MRNIVGAIPRGDDFFPRENVVNQIYTRLAAGNHLYIAAPRRVGKSAILYHLQDNPRDHYEFKYIITEALDNPLIYFQKLSESLYSLKSLPKKSLETIKNFFPIIQMSLLATTGIKVEFDNKIFYEFKQLISTLDTQGKTVVIMIDEFPQAVENIWRQQGTGGAEQFLQFNREIRQQASANIRFILTGSIGLPNIAEKLTATKTINDLNVVELPSLTRTEGLELLKQLLAGQSVSYEESALEYLLAKIDWLVPFYLQLAVQALLEGYSGATVTKPLVDQAFAAIFQQRHNIYFQHYYDRLNKVFTGNEYDFALALLTQLSQQLTLSRSQIQALAAEHQLTTHPRILRTLEADGYLFRTQTDDYSFTSPVLKAWWQHNVF